MTLETLDFTGVSEGYCENGKPERLGIYTRIFFMQNHLLFSENGKPERLGIYTLNFLVQLLPVLGENGKPERLGIYTNNTHL